MPKAWLIGMWLNLRKLFRRRVVLWAALVLLLVMLSAIAAPWLTPFDPNETAVAQRLRAPSGAHWLGTDELGRDVLSRIAFGARFSLAIAAFTAACAVVCGATIGLLAGFFRQLDGPLMRLVDALMALPDILLAIALVAILGPSLWNLVLALALVYTPRVARVVRAATLVVRELLFVEAARALGASPLRILRVHVLPQLMSPLLVQASFIFAYAVLAEAALSFLGVGVPPEIPTWGTMVAGSQQYVHQQMGVVLYPGLAIIATALCLQLVGDGVRDLLDPRLRKTM
jgi:peptide/nickel transport system permease protein